MALGGFRQDRRRAAEFTGDRQDIEARGAAASDDDALARIDALAHGDLVNGLDHQLIGDGYDGKSRVRHAAPRSLRQRLDHAMRRGRIQPHPPAIEIIRVEPAEHHAGVETVGDRRRAVTRRTWNGPGDLRTDPQQTAGVDPGDRSAARADTRTSTVDIASIWPSHRRPSQLSRV